MIQKLHMMQDIDIFQDIFELFKPINPLRAKFFRGNIDIYSHFVSFLHIGMMQVVEILPQIRQEPTYST